MDMRKAVTSILKHVPASQRRRLKSIYKRKPGFGKKAYYSSYGEDAFLQGYFRGKLHLSSSGEMMVSKFLRKAVGPGYYVDIGAHAPIEYSNTYWFYLHGWSGINVDAAPGSMDLFRRVRARDINLEALISDEEIAMDFYHWDTPFDVNTLSIEHAEYFTRLYGREPAKITLRSRRLDNLLDEYLPPDQPISFMTVDVEGHDLHVLRSNDWERFRPELLLVEDFHMDVANPAASQTYEFMRQVGYEMYAWLHPTVVYRQPGMRDWLVPPVDTSSEV